MCVCLCILSICKTNTFIILNYRTKANVDFIIICGRLVLVTGWLCVKHQHVLFIHSHFHPFSLSQSDSLLFTSFDVDKPTLKQKKTFTSLFLQLNKSFIMYRFIFMRIKLTEKVFLGCLMSMVSSYSICTAKLIFERDDELVYTLYNCTRRAANFKLATHCDHRAKMYRSKTRVYT